jgi:hypothetical protein
MVYLKGNMQIPKEDASLFVQRSESRQYKMMEWLGYTNKQTKQYFSLKKISQQYFSACL